MKKSSSIPALLSLALAACGGFSAELDMKGFEVQILPPPVLPNNLSLPPPQEQRQEPLLPHQAASIIVFGREVPVSPRKENEQTAGSADSLILAAPPLVMPPDMFQRPVKDSDAAQNPQNKDEWKHFSQGEKRFLSWIGAEPGQNAVRELLETESLETESLETESLEGAPEQ